MAKESKKNQVPSCACGKTDLYEEWLKQNEKETNDITILTSNEHESVKSPVCSKDNNN